MDYHFHLGYVTSRISYKIIVFKNHQSAEDPKISCTKFQVVTIPY